MSGPSSPVMLALGCNRSDEGVTQRLRRWRVADWLHAADRPCGGGWTGSTRGWDPGTASARTLVHHSLNYPAIYDAGS